MISEYERPSWDEYFILLAKLVSIRSTCLAVPVGAVIVKDRQVLATGYNGPPSVSPHCTEQGFCQKDVSICSESILPSRSVHAESNAIAQAAKFGVSVRGSILYVTIQPCLACLKLIVASGISAVCYEFPFSTSNGPVYEEYENLIDMKQVEISKHAKGQASHFMLYPGSIVRMYD